jgi:1-acyl-sn-glycerol-3-phosphate acyltransferase
MKAAEWVAKSAAFRDQLRRDLAYRTPDGRASWRFGCLGWVRAACFHVRIIWVYVVARRLIRRGCFDLDAYAGRSWKCVAVSEQAGGRLEVTGLEHLAKTAGPVVVIGNHMSSLETLVLPGLILPFKDVAFVVKQSLCDHFIFGPIMRSVKMIPVGRANPREDLKTVLTRGAEYLRHGVSVVIFPQATRSVTFDPTAFNSLGAKLAERAGAPVIPLALKTDFMANGTLLKDVGAVDPAKMIHFAFGAPIRVEKNDKNAHGTVVDFVKTHLREWGGMVEAEEGGG